MNRFNHCPYKQATLIQQALASDKSHIAFFIGAGCPVSIKEKAEPLIPDIDGLTQKISTNICSLEFGGNFKKIIKRLNIAGYTNPNIEQILTSLRNLKEIVNGGQVEGLTADILDNLDKTICAEISKIVSTDLPKIKTAYHKLAVWIRAIQRSYPIEIFTTNYDILMETALETYKVPYFDGFVGSNTTFFDLVAIEQDKLPTRWARLWKIHGSINWWITKEGDVIRIHEGNQNSTDRQMIYPSHLKYAQSRRMPYLAMLDRLKAFLSQNKAVLIICGYSFADEHLNEVILQGLTSNPTAICFGLKFGNLSGIPSSTIAQIEKHANFSLLANDKAIIGTRQRVWKKESDKGHILHGIAVNSNPDNPDNSEFMLTDFAALGDFLEWQLPQYIQREEEHVT